MNSNRRQKPDQWLRWTFGELQGAAFCVDAWETVLRVGRQAPLISNTDQGSPMFIDAAEPAGVEVNIVGRERWLDNRPIEGPWRRSHYESVYLQDCGGGLDTGRGLGRWFNGYNREQPHQMMDYASPTGTYQAT